MKLLLLLVDIIIQNDFCRPVIMQKPRYIDRKIKSILLRGLGIPLTILKIIIKNFSYFLVSDRMGL